MVVVRLVVLVPVVTSVHAIEVLGFPGFVTQKRSVASPWVYCASRCIGRCMDNSQGNRSEQSPALEIKQRVCAVCSCCQYASNRYQWCTQQGRK